MRYTVLTYIFNGYEKVHEIGEKDPDAEYILVTDDPSLTSSTWDVVHDSSLDGLTPFDKCYQVRFHPFRYANTNIVVRVDGSIIVNRPLSAVVDEFERGKYDRCLMIHPSRNTMPAEYHKWVEARNYPRAQANKCLAMMLNEGYDMTFRGMYQGCFEIVRDNKANTDLNDDTYALLVQLGSEDGIERIDQTILSFLVNTRHKRMKVLTVSEHIVKSSLMTWCRHGSSVPLPPNPGMIEPYFRDARVNPYMIDEQ